MEMLLSGAIGNQHYRQFVNYNSTFVNFTMLYDFYSIIALFVSPAKAEYQKKPFFKNHSWIPASSMPE